VLDSVESLRQETFQSEAIQPAQTVPAPEVTRRTHFRTRATLRLLIMRLRFSKRAPYWQIRAAVSWSLVMIGVIATVLFVLRQS
jgi:hypothetical protein